MLTLCEPSSALQREPLQTVEELIRGQCGLRARWKSIQQSSDSAALKNTKPQEEHLPPRCCTHHCGQCSTTAHAQSYKSLPKSLGKCTFSLLTMFPLNVPHETNFLYSLIPTLANTVGTSTAAKPRPKLVKQMHDKHPIAFT